MKKLLYVLGIVLGLSSCIGVDPRYKKNDIEYKKTDDGRNVEIVDSDIFYNMRYIEFDGHEYVYYRGGHKGSMCHSPKCKCLNEYKK